MKRTYLLFEILISLTIASLLLTTLFRFLISNRKFEQKIEQIQDAERKHQYLYEKLHSAFFALNHLDTMPPLYTETAPKNGSDILTIHYLAGIDPDPAFSGHVIGQLFLDEERNLRFVQSTLDRKRERSEVLMSNIFAIEWQFLGPLTDDSSQATAISGDWGWFASWKREKKSSPSLIRLNLWHNIDKKKQGEPNLRFAFILSGQDPIRIIKKA